MKQAVYVKTNFSVVFCDTLYDREYLFLYDRKRMKMKKQTMGQLTIEYDDLLYLPEVVYAQSKGRQCHLQLILPYRYLEEEEEGYPLLVFIPGDAWHGQGITNVIPAYSRIAERGVAVALISFRTVRSAPYPAQIRDIKEAICFLKRRAKEFHINPDQIFVAGNAVGGCLALLTGLTAACGELEPKLYAGTSYQISGIIAYSAPEALTAEKSHKGAFEQCVFAKEYIKKTVEIPPILLFHRLNDDTVPVQDSRSLFEALREADKEAAYYEISGGEHSGAVYWTKDILDCLENFIKCSLG